MLQRFDQWRKCLESVAVNMRVKMQTPSSRETQSQNLGLMNSDIVIRYTPGLSVKKKSIDGNPAHSVY